MQAVARVLHSRAASFAVAAAAVALPTLYWSQQGGVVRTDGLVRDETLANTRPLPALSPSEFRSFKLTGKEQLTHDTAKYTFSLPRASDELGLTVASCLVTQAEIDGKTVMRPYTPTSPVGRRGSFELVVKSYPEGKVSKWLGEREVGSSIDFKGPFTKFEYVPNAWEAVGLIAGGTGIAPMYQLIDHILSNPRDKTEIRLLYASRAPADIIFKTELDALSVKHPNLKILYVVDKADEGFLGAEGFINAGMVTSFLPPPQPEAGRFKIMVCGPPGMMQAISGEKKSPSDQGELSGLLKTLNYTPDTVFKY